MNEKDNRDNLFFKVWRNQFIKSIIFKHVELFKFYKVVSFESRNEMLTFNYRYYISELVYDSFESLSEGDIPNNILKLNLKKLIVSNVQQVFKGIDTIKEIQLPLETQFNDRNTPIIFDYSKLPKSIKSILSFKLNNYNNNNYNNYKNNNKSTIINIPNNFESIVFSDFNQTLLNNIQFFPNKLKKLDLSNNWNNGGKILQTGVFPIGLEELSIIGYTQKLGTNIIPNTVKILQISQSPQYTLRKGTIPNSVLNLKINVLKSKPSTNEKQFFYNSGYERMVVQQQFNNNKTIYSITDQSIPNSVKSLFISSCEINIKVGSLPDSIENLKIGNCKRVITKSFLPKKLKSLDITSCGGGGGGDCRNIEFSSLPNTLTELKYHMDFRDHSNLLISNNEFPLLFPSTLLKLHLGRVNEEPYLFIKKLSLLSSLKILIFDTESKFNEKLEVGQLPYGLEEISFGSSFNQILLPGVLPSSYLKVVTFGKEFNQQLSIGSIPRGVEILNFSNDSKFNQSIDTIGILPSTLLHLKFGEHFQSPITKLNVLPPSLKTLQFSKSFNKNLISKELIPYSTLIKYNIKQNESFN
ncbi:hypothetical protein ACTFIV_009710 [Dictyostelium citrinum]